MLRVRFNMKFKRCNGDYRPILWPIKHPYWCTGKTPDSFTLVAYVKDENELFNQWPEAYILDIEEVEKIEFNERFPKPKWYKEE